MSLDPVCQTTDCSTTPKRTAATTMVGIRSMRPMAAAASVGSSRGRPRALPMGSPMTPARRMRATVASREATAQTTMLTRLTGTPRSEARSELSAQARTATPMWVRLRNQAKATIATGTAAMASRSLPWNTTLWKRKAKLKGEWKFCGATLTWKAAGSPTSAAASTALRPRVATVRMSRGALAKRRMTTNSTMIPSATPATSPVRMPTT